MQNEVLDLATKMIKSIDNKMGQDTMLLDLSEISSICDYFIITSAPSDRQVKSIADEVQNDLEEEEVLILHKEGYDSARWILLDYGDIVVHVFNKEDREFYNIEGIWKDAKTINIDNIIKDNI